MPFRLVQASDTHLSRRKAYFQANFEAFLAEMRADPPDLIVHSGDLCFDAVEEPDDLAFARAQMDRMPAPWRAIPGNHDIGDQWPDAKFGQPVDAAKLAAWNAQFGVDRWVEDAGGWRIVGLNGMLFDSPLPEEAEQWAWLDAAMAGAGGRPIMVFAHKPLFLDDAEAEGPSTMCVGAGSRRRLLAAAERHGARVFASGHAHRRWTDRAGGMDLVWAPAVGFVMGGPRPDIRVGTAEVGYVEHLLDGARATHRFVKPPTFEDIDMRPVLEQYKSTVHLPPKPLPAGMG
jgi:3',5'-cyclic AMP phosphodiesterase CpdA